MQALDLSVVIPTFDRPSLLRETLESVLGQTVPPREIVVVDNGYRDETAALLEEYRGRVTALRMEPAGVQAARNLGIRSTTTTWVALLDDDDLWAPTYLETVRSVLVDGRADLVYCDHRKFAVTPEGQRHYAPATKAEDAPPGYWDGVPRAAGEPWSYVGSFPPERLLSWNAFFLSTTVIRRDLLDRIGLFDPAVPSTSIEDMEFLARALTHGRLAMIWEPLVLYRLHDSNESRRSATAVRTGRWEVFEHLYASGAAGSPGLAAALERDLPVRRGYVFDLAFRYHRDDLMARVMPLLRAEDWTLKRRLKRAALRLPTGLRRRAVDLTGRLTPGYARERAQATRNAPAPAYPADAPTPADAASRADSH